MSQDTEAVRGEGVGVRERPVLFSGPMVRAILDGKKTQTRRVVRGVALQWLQPNMFTPAYVAMGANGLSPYGYAGDRLWVRETWWPNDCGECIAYRADGEMPAHMQGERWRPSIHMPRAASRLTLEVTGVRVERLQDITPEDVRREGIHLPLCACDVCAHSAEMCPADGSAHLLEFRDLWDSINGDRAPWDANPWVWVVSFRPLAPAQPAVTSPSTSRTGRA